MLKDRGIQVKLVNTKNSDTNETPSTPPVDYVKIEKILHDTTETVAKYVAIGVAGYVAADTLRQILVKLTPAH